MRYKGIRRSDYNAWDQAKNGKVCSELAPVWFWSDVASVAGLSSTTSIEAVALSKDCLRLWIQEETEIEYKGR